MDLRQIRTFQLEAMRAREGRFTADKLRAIMGMTQACVRCLIGHILYVALGIIALAGLPVAIAFLVFSYKSSCKAIDAIQRLDEIIVFD